MRILLTNNIIDSSVVSVASRTKVGAAPRAAIGGAAAAAAEDDEEEGDGAGALTAAEVQHIAMLPTCGTGFPIVKCEFSDAPTILERAAASGALLRGMRLQGAMDRLSAVRVSQFELAGDFGRANVGGIARFKLELEGYALGEYALAGASRKEKIRLAIWRLLFLTKRQLETLDAALEGSGGGGGAAETGDASPAALGFTCRDFDHMDAASRRSVVGLLSQVCFYLPLHFK